MRKSKIPFYVFKDVSFTIFSLLILIFIAAPIYLLLGFNTNDELLKWAVILISLCSFALSIYYYNLSKYHSSISEELLKKIEEELRENSKELIEIKTAQNKITSKVSEMNEQNNNPIIVELNNNSYSLISFLKDRK